MIQEFTALDGAVLIDKPAGPTSHDVVDAVVTKLKDNDIAGGFCAGIERCGTLLAHAYPAVPGNNPDELSNRLVEES